MKHTTLTNQQVAAVRDPAADSATLNLASGYALHTLPYRSAIEAAFASCLATPANRAAAEDRFGQAFFG